MMEPASDSDIPGVNISSSTTANEMTDIGTGAKAMPSGQQQAMMQMIHCVGVVAGRNVSTVAMSIVATRHRAICILW